MNPAVVHIETVVKNQKKLWRVRLGRRTLTFHEELAARAFANQLRMRRLWHKQQARREPEVD